MTDDAKRIGIDGTKGHQCLGAVGVKGPLDPLLDTALSEFVEQLGPVKTVFGSVPALQSVEELLKALQTIVANARIQPDASMDGTTDIYAVPLDDIEAGRELIARVTGSPICRHPTLGEG